MKENDKLEKHEYEIKFEFKNGESYTLSYSYDSKSQSIKYENVKLGHAEKLKKFFEKQVLDLESALICAMQQNEVENLTAENIKASEDQIKNNLVKIDLGENFLVDIIPDIFGLQNSCKNNLKVVYPDSSYVELNNKRVKVSGKYQDTDCENKSEQIVNQVKEIHKQNGNKKITFVEKRNSNENWDDDRQKNEISPSWIFTYVCEEGYGNYDIYYEDLESIKYFKATQDLDSQKSENNEKISRAGKIARIIFLIILIAIAIFLLTYLGIVGLLFSNVAIPIVVFFVEAILITLIVILILSIKDINSQNNLSAQLRSPALEQSVNSEKKLNSEKKFLISEDKDNDKGIE